MSRRTFFLVFSVHLLMVQGLLAQESIDDRGKVQSLTLVLSTSAERSGGLVAGASLYHFVPTARVRMIYTPGEASFFETNSLTLPTLTDYSKFGAERFDYTLNHPGGQQHYTLGGGNNQLDIYDGTSHYSTPNFLLYTGIGFDNEVHKIFEDYKSYDMPDLRLVKEEGNPSTKHTGSEFVYRRDYRIVRGDDPEDYLWRATLFSRTGSEGPYDLTEFYRDSKTVYKRSVNSEFVMIGDLTFPRTIRVMKEGQEDRTITFKEIRVNEEIDPQLFEPIRPNPGAVIILHQKDGNGDTITTRLDLPRPNQFTKVLEDLLTDQPDASEQIVFVNEPDKAEAKTDTNGAESVDASDQEEIRDHAPSRWRLPLALVLILGCGTAIFLGRRKG